MLHMSNRIGCVAILAIAAGCASPGARSPEIVSGITTSRTDVEVRVQAAPPSRLEYRRVSPDSMWKLLPKAFSDLGIKAGVMQPRVYGNNAIVMSNINGEAVRGMFRCGNEGTGPSSTVQYRIEFDIAASPVARTGGGSELIIQTRALGTSVDATRSGKIDCVSNGALEKKLKAQIDEMMRM